MKDQDDKMNKKKIRN